MKHLTAMLSVLALLLSLCACSGGDGSGGSESASPEPLSSQAVSEEPVRNTDPVQTPVAESDPPQSGGELSSDERKAIAEGLIGRPVTELYDAIGEPTSSDYAPGCLGPEGSPSEDGELFYDGFTVYTVRTDSQEEYVYDVL